MNENITEINDMTKRQDERIPAEDTLQIDLLCGIGVSIDCSDMNWESIYNSIPDLDQNITVLKSMIFDLTHMPYPTDDSEDSASKRGARDNASVSVFVQATDAIKSIGIEDINYDVTPTTTVYEKALLACMDAILIYESIISEARVEALIKVDTSSMIDKVLESMPITIDGSNIDDINSVVDTITKNNPLPAMDETDNKEE